MTWLDVAGAINNGSLPHAQKIYVRQVRRVHFGVVRDVGTTTVVEEGQHRRSSKHCQERVHGLEQVVNGQPLVVGWRPEPDSSWSHLPDEEPLDNHNHEHEQKDSDGIEQWQEDHRPVAVHAEEMVCRPQPTSPGHEEHWHCQNDGSNSQRQQLEEKTNRIPLAPRVSLLLVEAGNLEQVRWWLLIRLIRSEDEIRAALNVLQQIGKAVVLKEECWGELPSLQGSRQKVDHTCELHGGHVQVHERRLKILIADIVPKHGGHCTNDRCLLRREGLAPTLALLLRQALLPNLMLLWFTRPRHGELLLPPHVDCHRHLESGQALIASLDDSGLDLIIGEAFQWAVRGDHEGTVHYLSQSCVRPTKHCGPKDAGYPGND
mmetsp:Transcript_26389/g.61240  ORF Transcript_26389/g.61240 Transcript_26389/m.61240 type:complete len:375 (+) Transcript_26389:3119-4243(+)